MIGIAYVKWIGAAAALVAYSAFWYHMGGQGTRLKVASAEVKQEKAEGIKRTADQQIVAQEGKTYAAAKADDLDPVRLPDVRVCYYAPLTRVPSTHTAGSGSDAPAAVRQGPAQDPDPGANITPSIVHVGNIANAQVAGLQDYINRVCQGRAP